MARPCRSVLYMPGSNARALEKAKTLDADCLILDLEDAVAPEQKEMAREQVCATVNVGGFGFRQLIIRANAFDTPYAIADFAAIAASKADAILVPKVNSAQDIAKIEAMLKTAPPSLKVWVMMETALAMLNAQEIATCAALPNSRLTTFVLGTNDLAKETKARLVGGRAAMVPWLMGCLTAARAYGLQIIDGVYNDIENGEGFAKECQQALEMGFDGKTLIHPAQISGCNSAFMPSEGEVLWGQKIIEAFDLPENAGEGALRLEGKMVEILHRDMARDMLSLVQRVQAR
jgi:citrate lyase subunit beta / citryl-CoA lyase